MYKISLFGHLIGIKQNKDGKFLIPEELKPFFGIKTSGLKPAHEPITIFQKPLEGTYIQNIEKYGCGGMNIDACRVGVREKQQFTGAKKGTITDYGNYYYDKSTTPLPSGRFPANIILD